MWTRNIDTGKWSVQTDTISKENYDSLKQDLEKVRLYSKCLSGATYLPIKGLGDIYDPLSISKIGYYINKPYNPIPSEGPLLPVDETNYLDVFTKYTEESAFTIKNLFTPEKLVKNQVNNFVEVDVSTTEAIIDINQFFTGLVIDGLRILEGHRILVKNQQTEITLPSTIDIQDYFTNTELVATYSFVPTVSEGDVVQPEGPNITWQWYNSENGIYVFTNNRLVKTNEFDTYKKAYRFSVYVKSGNENGGKQFHLSRLLNNYFPVSSENVFFEEKHNWILRNRVDYNNVFDLNYYDILHHPQQEIYNLIDSRTYSIPNRTIVVGEFGAIINNQDKLEFSATFSQSHIMFNKYKVNLYSIAQTEEYYFICGAQGTLLRVSKIDFSVNKINLGEEADLTSISFYGELNGILVGKFNTIYWTTNGGLNWSKYFNPSLEGYSYNKVIHFDLSTAYIGGESGIFLELQYLNNTWSSYKRKVTKQLTPIDEYELFDDINDLYKSDWTTIVPFTQSVDPTSSDFADSLVLENTIGANYKQLKINGLSELFNTTPFVSSKVECAFRIKDLGNNSVIYQNSLWGQPTWDLISYSFYDFYQFGTFSDFEFYFNLPIEANGNLRNTTYQIDVDIWYNYDGVSNSISLTPFKGTQTYQIQTLNNQILLIGCNGDNIICYDKGGLISNIDNQFIYFTSTQSHGDIKTISRSKNSSDIYVGGDNIYKFDIRNFLDFTGTSSNSITGTSSLFVDKYVNKILLDDYFYICGNNSLVEFSNYSATFSSLDPTFNDDLKSRLLFLDYDVASKLNFFTDEGEYRLASSVTFSATSFTQSSGYLNISNLSGELNWLNYYKDSQKTFKYYSSISDSNKIEFSSTFSYTTSDLSFNFVGSEIGIDARDIIRLAPNISSQTQSLYIENPTQPIASFFNTTFKVLLHKELIIFKRVSIPGSYTQVSEGDVLRLTSNVVDCNLIVNRIERYRKSTGSPNSNGTRITSWPTLINNNQFVETYIYCYAKFNDNIIRNLNKSTTNITVTNLNRYSSIGELVANFESHQVSDGYKLDYSNDILTLSQRFNNKTAYYNLQSKVDVSGSVKNMTYAESFLNFGYSPQYNILDYLTKLDSNRFTSSTVFTLLPQYYNLPGNNGNSFTNSNIYIDLSEGFGTFSWYRSGTNEIIFGQDYKFEWESFLKNTFVDLTLTSTTYGSQTNQRLLIVDKYYNPQINGWVMKFDKKIEVSPANSFDVSTFNIRGRNRLDEISQDLQLLNNIQRTTNVRTVQSPNTFTNYENNIISKFYTDSYCKILCSDYRIRQALSGIIYVDDNYEMAFNVLNLSTELKYGINNTVPQTGLNGFGDKLGLFLDSAHELKVGDLIYVEFNGGSQSSEYLNPNYFGYQTVIYSSYNYIVTSVDFGVISVAQDVGTITFIKKDPFFNYEPVDIFNLGVDKLVTRSVEVLPENWVIQDNKYNLINLNLNNFKIRFVDGLSLLEVNTKYSWLLEAEISNAIIGKNDEGLVWYSGTWKCGRWFGGTWYSGTWVSGDWYRGNWYSFNTQFQGIGVNVDTSYVDNLASRWLGGRWFDGNWNGGTWYNGRFYNGTWEQGLWYNGIFNNGRWASGRFEGGVWVSGGWRTGTFNCDKKPSYWLDGTFRSGDFENGIWYNGVFGSNNTLPRFGTRANNSRTANWFAGKWINGEFHSFLNFDVDTGDPIVSDIHKYSIWRTGVWLNGNFFGGIAYNIDFRGGVWKGGILEEIQVTGVDAIIPQQTSNNAIVTNGNFKFNIGDEIWIIDDYTAGAFSYLGNNDNPRKYRINNIIDDESTKTTKIFLNYNLSTLGVDNYYASQTYSNVETGLRIVSYFKEVTWESGVWTNGIFDGGNFLSGIWYNGIFTGVWGN